MSVASEKFVELYVTEHDRLERQISKRIGCRATASDLVHDIFLRLWERATQRNGSDAAYLSRCARNATLDHVRTERRRGEYFAQILPEQYASRFASEVASPHDVLSASQTLSNIETVLAELPRKTRHIFLLNRVHGRSFSEIAAVFGISQRAVAKHMARAVAECEQAI